MRVLSKASLSLIQAKLKEKQAVSLGFSLRALAKQLKTSPATLSEALKGNRKLALDSIETLCRKLGLDAFETAFVMVDQDYEFDFAREGTSKALPSWEYWAILSLVSLKDFEATYSWVSKKVRIEKALFESIWQTLEKDSWVKYQNNKWEKAQKSITFQKMDSKQGHMASSWFPNAMTFLLNKEQISKVQILIEKFKLDLAVRFKIS